MKLRLFLSALALSVTSLAAQAATFSIIYEGTLTSDSGGGFAATGWTVGTPFRTVGVYDTTTPPFSSIPPSESYLTTATTLRVGTETVDMGPFGLTVGNDAAQPDGVTDSLLLQRFPTSVSLGGVTWTAVFNYAYFGSAALSGTALPTASPIGPIRTTGFFPSLFQLERRIFDSNSNVIEQRVVNGQFTSVTVVPGDATLSAPMTPIPLPAPALLLLGGLGGLALLRRRA